MSQTYSQSNESTNSIYGIVFESSKMGQKYEREVKNFGKAIAFIGGIQSILFFSLQIILSPFYKDQIVYEVAKRSKIAKENGLSTYKFKLYKMLSNLLSCNQWCHTKKF